MDVDYYSIVRCTGFVAVCIHSSFILIFIKSKILLSFFKYIYFFCDCIGCITDSLLLYCMGWSLSLPHAIFFYILSYIQCGFTYGSTTAYESSFCYLLCNMVCFTIYHLLLPTCKSHSHLFKIMLKDIIISIPNGMESQPRFCFRVYLLTIKYNK